MPPGYKAQDEDVEMPELEPTPKAAKAAPPKPETKPETKAPEPEPTPTDPDAESKKAADEHKANGTAAYKARKFDEAAQQYEQAWSTYPKDITYLTNLAGACYHRNC